MRDARALAEVLPQALRAYPNGVLVEEFVAGTDVTVPFLEGRGDEGVLLPVDYLVDPSARSRFNLYDYRLKSADASKVSVRCPPDLPRDVVSRLRAISKHGGARAGHPRSRAHRLPRRRGRPPVPAGGERAAVAGAGRQPVRGRRARGAGLRRDAARDRRERGAAPGPGRQAGRAPAAARRSAAHRLHVQRQARRPEGRQRRRGRVRRARDDRRDPRGAGELRPRDAVRGDAELPRQLDADAGRSGVQHRRGRRGPEPRGGRARAVRADGHPVHRARTRRRSRSRSTRRCRSACSCSTRS